MARNNGSAIDVGRRVLRERDRNFYPVDRAEAARSGAYYTRGAVMEWESFERQERWILPEAGLSVARFDWKPTARRQPSWYIEPDLITVSGDVFDTRDGFLDLEVYEGVRYEVEDLDEFAEALASGEITFDEGQMVMMAFHRLLTALRQNGMSGEALLRELAPDLPGPRSYLR